MNRVAKPRACWALIATLAATLIATLGGGVGCGQRPMIPPAEDVVLIERVDVQPEIVEPIDPCGPAVCGRTERCGPTNDAGFSEGNSVDDDCNGRVDEGCRCRLGTSRACFPGASDRRGVGRCRDGTLMCGELGTWLDCAGFVGPANEECNGIDDDCDGMLDEGLVGCGRALACPAFINGEPLREVTVNGAAFSPDATGFH